MITPRIYFVIGLGAIVITLYAMRDSHTHYLPDLTMLALALLTPRPLYAIGAVAVLSLVRHSRLSWGLVEGVPGWLIGVVLPGARYLHMSSGDQELIEIAPELVHVPVHGLTYEPPPQSADLPDTIAVQPGTVMVDRDITEDGLIDFFCAINDPKTGKPMSASEVYRRVGGHRATVLAKVKAIRESAPPMYRQEDQTVAPATHPVSSQ